MPLLTSRPPSSGQPAVDVVLLAALYAVELSAAVLMMAIPRLGDQPMPALWASRPRIFCLIAGLIAAASGAIIARRYRKSRGGGPAPFAPTVAINLVSVGGLVTIAELAVRLLAFPTAEGLMFLNTPLRPRSWPEVVSRNREIIRQAASQGAYLVYDELMGWTVGANRRSADGLSFSSAEGIRSPRPDMAFADRPAAHRIALVGDSFTFCLDVPYEASWGYRLERELGPDFQVLNFGVSGYGVDQAYLRYRRDVRPWKPEVVIFGVFPHDFVRTMTVYSFVSFPEWESPFAKPRFAIAEGRLAIFNVPPLPPEAIFSHRSIADLPFIEYDKGFHPVDWEWRWYHRAYLWRYVISAYPRWPQPAHQVSDAAMGTINGEILRDFVGLARAEGTTPIVVYLPARRDLAASRPEGSTSAGLAQEVMRQAAIDYTDLTPCLLALQASERFVVGARHYSPRANAAIARCLSPVVRRHVAN
jgi:hypothetical protein